MTAILITEGVGYDIDTKLYITDFVQAEDGSYTGQLLDPLATTEQLIAIATDKISRNISALASDSTNSATTKSKITSVIQHTTGYIQSSLNYIGTVADTIDRAEPTMAALGQAAKSLLSMFAGLHPTILVATTKLQQLDVLQPPAATEGTEGAEA